MKPRKTAFASVLAAAAAVATVAPSFAGVSLGVFLDGATDTMIDNFFTATQQHAIVQYALVFESSNASNHTTLMNAVRNNNATPMCVWGTRTWSFDKINSGDYDTHFQDVAGVVKDFNDPVIFALFAEFNNKDANPQYADSEKYKQAWQHIHKIFANRGAKNAQWAFCPNYASNPASTDYSAYYPDDAYVDWVGALGFDTDWLGGCGSADMSFNDLFGPVLADEASRYPHKPQIVMWFATSETDASRKASWISASYGSMGSYPNLRAVVWYNKRDTVSCTRDYRVVKNPADAVTVPSSVTDAYTSAIKYSALFLDYLPPYDDIIPDGGGGGVLDITPVPPTVARGANITINYAFTGITQRVDAYLGVVMTDGTLLVMDSRQVFQSNIVPIAANYDVSGNPSGGLTFTVPTTIPTGVYTFEAVWVPAGTPASTAHMNVAPVTVN